MRTTDCKELIRLKLNVFVHRLLYLILQSQCGCEHGFKTIVVCLLMFLLIYYSIAEKQLNMNVSHKTMDVAGFGGPTTIFQMIPPVKVSFALQTSVQTKIAFGGTKH